MKIESRSYGGKLFRPKPVIHQEPDSSLLIVATPWGPKASAETSIRIIQDYIYSSREDFEATSPFDKLDCLSPLANHARIALRLTNDTLYREENRNEYKAGIEITLFAISKNEVVIANSGHPQIFLDRAGVNLTPLCTSPDLPLNASDGRVLPAPLPINLLGTHSTSNINIFSFKRKAGDRLVLLSRSVISHEFYALSRAERSLETMTTSLSKADADNPFWLGLIEI